MAEVESLYRKVADHGNVEAQIVLGMMYQRGEGVAKDAGEAARWFQKAAASETVQGLNSLAWFLATSEESKVRDGPRAVELAEKAVAATDRKDAMILDTLAAAYAEAGQFTKAVNVQQEAMALLRDERMKADFASRLKLYESETPYREVAVTPIWVAHLCLSQGRLAEAERIFREAFPSLRTQLPADHPELASALAGFTSTLLAKKKFAEAEPLARECLTIREKKLPDSWLTFNTRSLLGGSLLGQQKYEEAEPLLLSGCEGMEQRQETIPAAGKPRIKEALERLVQLYEERGKSDKAAEWRAKLSMEFGKDDSKP